MNDDIIKILENNLQITKKQIQAVIKLLSDGNTIPFIARYRKEATNGLDEEKIREIQKMYEYEDNLYQRKQDVIRLIQEKGLMTEELKQNILACQKLIDVEDLYLPYKEKKKTKASEAIKNGLQGLADFILEFNKADLEKEALKYLNNQVKTKEEAIQGASYIIADMISDKALYRKFIRNYIKKQGIIKTKVKKNNPDVKKIYEIYYDYKERITKIKPYQILAINRALKENVLSLSFEYDLDYIINYLEKRIVRDKTSQSAKIVELAIQDSLKRLILPSLEREIRSEITEFANQDAILNFSHNLENLLLTPPIKGKTILALDPGFRTGTKVAVVDKLGRMLETTVIYPAPPHEKIAESEKIILDLIKKYQVDLIAIGNGTASLENEIFLTNLLKKNNLKISYMIVNEAGASVYSASPLAALEFPDLPVEKRSAISLARRIQDSLSELVKIDPKSIGVGLYQHDLPQKELASSLNFTVSKIVNQVGVNINNASPSLLSYVSGLKKNVIENILTYKDKVGKIKNRLELKKIKGMTDKVYEQSIGFLRITDGDNPLDKTDIHPDNYSDAINILNYLGLTLNDIGTPLLKEKINNNLNILKKELKISEYTFNDIINSLLKPNRDPRDDVEPPIMRNEMLSINSLKVHDKLRGTVRNVIDFGAFVDIGLHNDGLIHISKLSKNFVKHPSEILAVGDIVEVYVTDIDLERERVSLSLFDEV